MNFLFPLFEFRLESHGNFQFLKRNFYKDLSRKDNEVVFYGDICKEIYFVYIFRLNTEIDFQGSYSCTTIHFLFVAQNPRLVM